MKNTILMFHYFHDNEKYKKVQGSISAEELENLITKSKYKVISADIWIKKYLESDLKENEVCLSFDDGLKEQMEIALPILEKYNLKGIFNINTKPILKGYDELELYRYYRNYFFDNIDEFYNHFFDVLKIKLDNYEKINKETDFNNYLVNSKFYTYNDRKFRYFRDEILKDKYHDIMDTLIGDLKNSIETKKFIWMTKEDIKSLSEKGHLVGLHTHNHPTTLNYYSYTEQKEEFSENKKILEEITGETIKISAYPCGKYNNDTLKLMKELNILIGMIATCSENEFGKLAIKREDIANIKKELEKMGGGNHHV